MPIVFCTVVTGIAKMGDLRKVGRVGLKGIVYFEVLSTAALVIGLLVARVFQPGSGMNVSPASLDPGAVAAYAGGSHRPGTVDFILNVIPRDVVDAFARGEILQVLLVAILFGVGLAFVREDGQPVLAFLDGVGKVFFRIVALVMRLAPLGAFGAIAFTVGQYGLHTLLSLGRLILCFYATSLVFVLAVLAW